MPELTVTGYRVASNYKHSKLPTLLAGQAGLEPATTELTARGSTIELLTNKTKLIERAAGWICTECPYAYLPPGFLPSFYPLPSEGTEGIAASDGCFGKFSWRPFLPAQACLLIYLDSKPSNWQE